MAQSITGALARVQTLMDAITTFKSVPAYPPEKLAISPAAVVYLGAGQWHCVAMQMEFRGNLSMDVMVPRNQPDLQTAFKSQTALSVLIAKSLEGDPTLSNTVSQINFPIIQSAPTMTMYNEQEYVSVRWDIPVVVTMDIT